MTTNPILAALDRLGEIMFGFVTSPPCGDYQYKDPNHLARCRECRHFEKRTHDD